MTVEALTAAAIAKLAFDGVIQSGAGKLTETAIDKSRQLWLKIRGKLQEDSAAKAAIAEAEKQKSQKILEQKVVPFLQVAMLKDPQFAQEIQNIAQQVNQEINASSQKNITIGDVKATGSGAAAIGNFEGQAGSIGGIHTHEKK